jgi:putative GTP pyrophosphokinase
MSDVQLHPPLSDADLAALTARYSDISHDLKNFMAGVVSWLAEHPRLNAKRRIIHSHKARLKDVESFKKKIARKVAAGRQITPENLTSQITDLAGVRILHLFQEDFAVIDEVIRGRVAAGDWALGEQPRVYTWDPETAKYFGRFDLLVEQKESAYTSVHYLLRPRADSPWCCEVQVRTLFEEIWGEVDHLINYPITSEDVACREQLLVLSKVVGAGSRLLDSIYRTSRRHAAL